MSNQEDSVLVALSIFDNVTIDKQTIYLTQFDIATKNKLNLLYFVWDVSPLLHADSTRIISPS